MRRSVWVLVALSACLACMEETVPLPRNNPYDENGEAYVGPPTIPSPPGNVRVTPGDYRNTIAWDPAVGATSYNIYHGTSYYVSSYSGTKIAGVTSPYVHIGLLNGTTYRYVVTAVNAFGESWDSSMVSGTPSLALRRPAARARRRPWPSAYVPRTRSVFTTCTATSLSGAGTGTTGGTTRSRRRAILRGLLPARLACCAAARGATTSATAGRRAATAAVAGAASPASVSCCQDHE